MEPHFDTAFACLAWSSAPMLDVVIFPMKYIHLSAFFTLPKLSLILRPSTSATPRPAQCWIASILPKRRSSRCYLPHAFALPSRGMVLCLPWKGRPQGYVPTSPGQFNLDRLQFVKV